LHDSIRDNLLNLVNLVRSSVALGYYKPYGMSSSNDMNQLKWDCDLESIAQEAVQKCPKFAKFSGKPNAINFNYYAPGASLVEHSNPLMNSILTWIETAKVKWPANNSLNENRAPYNFANMINANATAVGCYIAHCGNRVSTACVFSQPKPRVGTLVYTSGNTCKPDSKCSSNKNGLCKAGLCTLNA
ncbi:hypothetical protein KIN20_027089, partial [Parelaphostrongylus tenuis]